LVSLVRALIIVLFLLTLASATAGLWVYNSHISPLKALASKPSLADVLDGVESLIYTMEFGDSTWRVEVLNDVRARSGVIKVYGGGGDVIAEYRFNYTRTTLIWLVRVEANGSLTFLDPLEYYEAFATNIKFSQAPDGSIVAVEPFPGIAPLYALTYVGNATLIDWSTFYDPRRVASPPQWVQIAFSKVRVEGGEARGVEVLIQPQQTPLIAQFKWYNVGVYAKLASLSRIPVAWELTLLTQTPAGETLDIKVNVESVKLRS
jgi:hypothetical protein